MVIFLFIPYDNCTDCQTNSVNLCLLYTYIYIDMHFGVKLYILILYGFMILTYSASTQSNQIPAHIMPILFSIFFLVLKINVDTLGLEGLISIRFWLILDIHDSIRHSKKNWLYSSLNTIALVIYFIAIENLHK